MVVDNVHPNTIMPLVRANIDRESIVMTDEAAQYRYVGNEFAGHGYTVHSRGEYGRGPIHTNTIEGYFSIFKRGMKGVYQHCGEQHLHRYLAEFDFRHNHREALGWTDEARCIAAIRAADGKRLTYHQPHKA